MSSIAIASQNILKPSNDPSSPLNSLRPIDILHKPIERVKMMTKAESDILSLFKDSLTHQYESFEFKFNTFKELLNAFKAKT